MSEQDIKNFMPLENIERFELTDKEKKEVLKNHPLMHMLKSGLRIKIGRFYDPDEHQSKQRYTQVSLYFNDELISEDRLY